MDSISIANNSLFSVNGRRCLIIALFGIFGLTIAYYVFQTIVFVQIKGLYIKARLHNLSLRIL